MSRESEAHRYTGMRPVAPVPLVNYWGLHNLPPGYCRQCGQPSSCYCCGCRECRKEAKELLVTPQQGSVIVKHDAFIGALRGEENFQGPAATAGDVQQRQQQQEQQQQQSPPQQPVGSGQAFIGGGCCVSLSVEYTPSSPTVQATVTIIVQDSEGTSLGWERKEQPGAGYRVKEGVITTNPGATLTVHVSDATARVRWCEIFSC